MMSSRLVLSREEYLNQPSRVLFFLENNCDSELVFDPSDSAVDSSNFECRDWTSSEFGRILSRATSYHVTT